MIDEDIVAAVSPIVPCYPLRRPQRNGDEPEILPIAVYTIVGSNWLEYDTLCGSGLQQMRVQTDIWAREYRTARNLAYQVAAALDALGWRLSITPFPDDDERIYRFMLEHSCLRNDRADAGRLKSQRKLRRAAA